jgi:hypothetical protein
MVAQVLRRRFLIGSSLVALMLSMPLDEGRSRDGVASNWQIPVSTLSVGNIGVASFSGFSCPASSIFSASNWGTTSKYIAATDSNHFVASLMSSGPNFETVTWTRNGCVFIRKAADGTAIYFRHNGETADGTLTVGVVFGLITGTLDANGTYVPLYINSNLSGTVAGYSTSSTAGAEFTFGCNGYDMYAKFNGVEFFRQQQFYNLIYDGVVSFQTISGYGFRDITVNQVAAIVLQTDPYRTSTIDIRDWGASTANTTGTMSASSNQITVASQVFSVGNTIIIQTGGESGSGLPGSLGVGGTWPALHYANATAQAADTSQPANTYSYIDNNIASGVWLWDGAIWSTSFQSGQPYLAKIIPLALVATVTGIAGNVLTVSASSSVATTATNVYLDCHPVLDNLFANPSMAFSPHVPVYTVNIPAGSFAISQALNAASHDNWTLAGVSSSTSIIFSPKGVESAYLSFQSCTNLTCQNFHLSGNSKYLTGGFGMDFVTNGPSGKPVYPRGILLTSCNNAIVQNCSASDHFQTAFGTSFSDGTQFTHCDVTVTEPIPQYIQWQILFADSSNSVATNCTVTSAYATGGLEGFRCDNFRFINCSTVNASYSSNSSGNFMFDGCSITMTALSQYSEVSFSHLTPLVNINSNISPPNSSMLLGGVINNQSITQLGGMNARNDTFVNITVNSQNPNVRITGSYPSCLSPKGLVTSPNWTGGWQYGSCGINNAATGTVVSGMRFAGNANYAGGISNVNDDGGTMSVTNCVMDHAGTGAGITESRTISNAAYGALCP